MEFVTSITTSVLSTIAWVGISNPWAFLAIVFCILWLFSFVKSHDKTDTSAVVKQLVQSSAQWNSSSLQDNSKILALMHANYAMAYMNAARSLASDSQIETWTHARMDELLREQQESQTKAIQSLGNDCPNTMPPGLSAVYTGWIVKNV